MEPNTFYFKHFYEIKKSCEKLITETQCDIEIFRNEQQHLQKKIQEIVVENNLINSKLEVLKTATTNIAPSGVKSIGESRDDATREKLTNEAFHNIKKQIDYLQAENADLRSLNKNLQKTIENLENEIQNYRNELFKPTSVCEVKQKYGTIITMLENSIKHKNSELQKQSQTIDTLCEQKKQLNERIEKADKLLKEKSEELENFAKTTVTISKLQDQLSETESHNKELQKSLKISRQAIEKRLKREQSALQKVGEALSIAEAAVADKEEAIKREKVVKEECENIASTIGQVMDEAARKVESDIEAIKTKYIDQEKLLIDEKKKLTDEIQNQRNFIQILNTRCKRFQQKYIIATRENENLSDQLAQAAKALSHLEENIKSFNQNNGENLQQNSTDQDNQIQQFIKNYRILRERYKTTINNLTKDFEEKICNLKDEVARITAENKALKLH